MLPLFCPRSKFFPRDEETLAGFSPKSRRPSVVPSKHETLSLPAEKSFPSPNDSVAGTGSLPVPVVTTEKSGLGGPGVRKQGNVELKDSPTTLPVPVDQVNCPNVACNTRVSQTTDVELQKPTKAILVTPSTVSTDNCTSISKGSLPVSVVTTEESELGSPGVRKQGNVEFKDSPTTLPFPVDQVNSPNVACNTRDSQTTDVELQTPTKAIPPTPSTVSTDNFTSAPSVAATISVAPSVDNAGERALNSSMANKKDISLRSSDREVKMIDVVDSPLFSDVQALLERGGYKFTGTAHSDGPCHRPCGRAFSKVQELQRDLCAYGVDCQCGGSAQGYAAACQCWNDYEKAILHWWVRGAVIRGP
jgi:hypothetical protein